MRKILLGLIGLLFAVPAVATDLPAGYTELQYIESTGTQYIDTGVAGNAYTDVNMKVKLIANEGRYLFGTDYLSKGNRGIQASSGQLFLSYGGVEQHGATVQNNVVYNLKAHYQSGQSTITLDGSLYVTNTSTGTVVSSNNLFLFGRNYSTNLGLQRMVLYSAQIYDNGSLVRNFVPAKNSSNVVGMYDTVSGTFFTNAGTGEFTAGPEVSIRIATTAYNTARFSPVVTELNDTIATIRDVVTNTINQTKAIADLQATKQTRPDETCPAGKKCLLVEDDAGQPHWYEIIESASLLPSGYTELQYIESTGTQYIDTGISTGTNIELKYKFKMTIAPANDGFASVLACRTSATSNSISQGLQSNRFYFGFGKNSETSQSMTVLNKDITVIQNKNQITINNEPYNYLNGYTTTFTDTSMLYLFARNNIGMGAANFFTGRVYYAQIYNNGALVADFVPAKNSSGVIGMYDTVSGEFFTNKGTGTFIAGPEI